jgi:hypothetical protein
MRYAILLCLVLSVSTDVRSAYPPAAVALDMNEIVKHQREWRTKMVPLLAASDDPEATPKARAAAGQAYQKASTDFAASAQKMYPGGTIVRVTAYVTNVTEYQKDPTGKTYYVVQLSSSNLVKPGPEESTFSCGTFDTPLATKLTIGQQVTLEGRYESLQAFGWNVQNPKGKLAFMVSQCTEVKGK